MNNQTEEMEEPQESQWPALSLAYEFVKPSYDWAMSRLNAVEGRIQTLLVFAATFTVSAPVLIASLAKDVSFTSGWFIAALAVFFVNMLVGTIAKVKGGIRVLSIQQMYEQWLDLSESVFKERAIYWAGRDFRANYTVVNTKGRVATVMSILFGVEAFLMVLWIIIHFSRT